MVSTNKKIRHIAEPHIRAVKKSNGKIFYHYCYGKDPEIYLGSADAILSAVQTVRALNQVRRVNRTKYTTDQETASIFTDRV